jgi:hypothetical protein
MRLLQDKLKPRRTVRMASYICPQPSVSGFGFRVSGFGFRVSGMGFLVLGRAHAWALLNGVGFGVSGLKFRV